jgi:hypothetical protein
MGTVHSMTAARHGVCFQYSSMMGLSTGRSVITARMQSKLSFCHRPLSIQVMFFDCGTRLVTVMVILALVPFVLIVTTVY